MKTKYLLIFLVPFLIFSCQSYKTEFTIPRATKGILDLQNWDFTKNGLINLEGEWKFKWMDINPGFIKIDYDDSHWEIYKVPNFWNEKTGKSHGYACFRLKVKNITGENLGIFLRNCHRSYSLFINEKEILKNGIIGTTRKTNIPQLKPEFSLLPGSNELSITMYVANFRDISGGIPVSPRIGNIFELKNEKYIKDMINFFILGIIFFSFLYHLILWFVRKRNAAYLFFALFCLNIFTRIIFGNLYLTELVSDFFIFDVPMKMSFLTMIIGLYLFISFLKELYPGEFSKKIFSTYKWITLLLIAFILAAPFWITSYLLYFFEFFLLIGSSWALFSIVMAFLHKKEDSQLILTGLIVLFITVINDIIFVNTASITISLVHLGLLTFIIIQSAVLSLRFSRAYSKAKYLSVNLQKEVKAQTKTIASQNKKLKKLNREKTGFFINVIHETKTPLTLIVNYLDKDIAERGPSDDLIIVKNNFDKLIENMNNFLDIEKINRGHIIYNHSQTINFSDILNSKIVLFRQIALKKGIEITANVKDMILTKIDPYALDRIINNLIENAIRYTETNGKIKINVSTNKHKIIFEVSDNGIGIPRDKQKRIFEPYYQISRKKSNFQGLGMGLSIVKAIMSQVNATIEVHSKENIGTSFILTFQKYDNTGGVTRNFKVSKPRDDAVNYKLDDIVQTNRKNILIVEDNKDLLFFLTNSIGKKYNIYPAINGKNALDRLSNIPKPDLIISDIMMDRMDGIQFYKELKKQKCLESIPFIFLTAKSGMEDKLKGIKQGAIDYIAKPFNIQELVLKIDSWIKVSEAIKHETLLKIGNDIYGYLNKKNNSHQNQADNILNSLDQLYKEYKISKREIEVISLLKTGLEYKEIADKLNISIQTVHTYMKRVFKKCKVNNKIELLNIFGHFK